MTTIKLLLAGLIASGLLTMPAGAHEDATTRRPGMIGGKAAAGPNGDWIYGNARIEAPHALFASPPRDEPGGVCDFGDNPMIC
ncbi:hypothetical protein [Bradyrhizobium genosp. P]|uniref:hypothetical protein n=1 Tax=Bradyrhizobium genosp. P TaxID=83641 RepID=UPI003CFA1947